MEEDIKILKELIETAKIHTSIIPDINFEPIYKEQIQAIENILNRLEQDERVIKAMAEHIEGHCTAFFSNYGAIAQEWEEYFRKKCE